MKIIKLTDRDIKVLLNCLYKATRWDSDLIIAHEKCENEFIKYYEKDLKADIRLKNKIKKQLNMEDNNTKQYNEV